MWWNKTNGGGVALKICGVLYSYKTYTDGHIRRHLGQDGSVSHLDGYDGS